MALGFIDGFDHYSAADITAKWTSGYGGAPVHNVGPTFARGTGQGYSQTAGAARGLQRTVWPGGSATITMGAACYILATPLTSGILFAFLDGASEQISVRGDGAGKLTVTRVGTVLATSTNVISLNTWHYIELKATINNTTGVIELRVDGTSTGWVPSTGSLNTRFTANNYATSIAIASVGAATSNYFDDLYALDSSGAVNTTFMGDGKATPRRPVAAGNYAQWTSNGGPNWANVADDPYYDGDISFNQSATANQIDSHIYEDIPASTGTIAGVQHVIWARKDVGAARQIAALQRSSSVDYVGTTQNVGTSYQMFLDMKETNPATSAAWTIADFNAAEFGVKEIS